MTLMNTDIFELERVFRIVNMLDVQVQGFSSDVLLNDIEDRDVRDAVNGVNMVLFGTCNLRADVTVRVWCSNVARYLEQQLSRPCVIDRIFYSIVEYAALVNREEMVRAGIASFNKMDVRAQRSYEAFYNSFDKFWGRIDIDAGLFDVLEQRIDVLVQCADELVWLYERLADYRSKNVLVSTLLNWLTFDVRYIHRMRDLGFSQYFDFDLYEPARDEVFVDLGAYTGDTIADYLRCNGRYKKIIAYEITPESIKKMRENVAYCSNIDIRARGVGDKADSMQLVVSSMTATANSLDKCDSQDQDQSQGTVSIDIVTLDEDIPEPVTTIKMDIEGAEQAALRGARGHIVRERPKLLISVYHGNTDLFEIPRLIDSMRSDYRFYLRSYGNLWAPTEIILYAL